MAKNISIKENGTAQTISGVTHINTNKTESGSTDWVPEDEANTKVKMITNNGTYNASDDSCMGYSAVFVSVTPTQITGVDTTDGKTYLISVGDKGILQKTLVDE